jgi:phosphotransferase system HPr (HPr) family protein
VISIDLVVSNPSGLHARPAALFAREAARFPCEISVANLDGTANAVDAKSILMLMTIGVSSGHRIRVTADGVEEAQAIAALQALVASGLGETAPPL